MTKRNKLTTETPHQILRAAYEVGENLRIARLRRGITMRELAARIGTGVRTIADAEQGKPSTSVAVYVAILHEYGLLDAFLELASPYNDEEGLRLLNMRTSSRAKKIDEDAPRFKSSRENHFLSYQQRNDRLDEDY